MPIYHNPSAACYHRTQATPGVEGCWSRTAGPARAVHKKKWLFAKLCGYCTPEKFSLCLGVLVVRPKHPDFTTEAQRHEDESEIASSGLPTES